jgi:PPM family protein phosphatase
VEICGRSDPGLVRDNNEDRFAVGDLDRGELLDAAAVARVEVDRRGPLFVVCDGMGGVQGGEIASQVGTEAVWEEMLAARPTAEPPVYARLLRRAIRVANKRVRDAAAGDPELEGMGTTISAAGIVGDLLILAQVGDSRAYVQRGSALVQVTRDQSVVSALVHAGRLTETEAARSVERGMILQALGTAEDVEVAISIAELRDGDRVLLCSDGLHGPVGDQELGELCAGEDLAAAADALIEAARVAGGPDNVTIILASFRGGSLKAPLDADDQPRFTEFDPMEEGERAYAHTSRVARRLAGRAGLRSDTVPPTVPATGQHAVVRVGSGDAGRARRPGPGPAQAALAERQRLGVVAWLLAALVVLAALALLLWDLR